MMLDASPDERAGLRAACRAIGARIIVPPNLMRALRALAAEGDLEAAEYLALTIEEQPIPLGDWGHRNEEMSHDASG
jgi:hypothetical protein